MNRQPANLLFILGESHAPHLLGAVGNPFIKTPNLDRLAAGGLLFETAYCASPLCVPARAAIATGRFPHETGFWESSTAFDGSRMSWMRRLREAGYETVGIGKMHFRSDDDDNGFSRFIETMHIADGVGDLVGALRYDGSEPSYQGLWDLWTSQYGAGDAGPYRRYDERIIERSIDWMKTEAAGDSPWALSVHFIAAHAPFVVPGEYLALYDPDDLPLPIRFRQAQRPRHPAVEHLREIMCHADDVSIDHVQKIRAAYFATITYLDTLVGRLLAALDELGLSESTRIVYTSDHGFSCGDHYLFGLFHFYEESLKVPLIMAGPGIPRGTRLAEPVSHVDLYPTILEACGVPLTAEERAGSNRSLWPLIDGDEHELEPVFAEYHGCGTASGGFVLRDGPLKLVYFVGLPPQLFDLAADPDEANDLGEDPRNAPLVDGMMRKLRAQIDPEAIDKQAKRAQRELIEAHGGKETVLREKGGFSYSPPPGMHWRELNPDLE